MWPNTSTLGLKIANGVGTSSITLNYSSPAATSVACIPFFTTIPQNASAFGRIDSFYLADPFVGLQITGSGTALNQDAELGGTPAIGSEFGGPTWPTSTWQTVCNMVTTVGGTATQSQATWDASGNYIAGSGFTTTNTSAYASTNIEIEAGVNLGPASTSNYFGTFVGCGLVTASTNCTFPLIPGYQLVTPTDSPGQGIYGTTQSVTLSSPSAIAPTLAAMHYSTSGAATCGSTLYSGAFNVSSTSTVSSVTCSGGFPTSPALSSLYQIFNLPYTDSFSGTSNLTTPWLQLIPALPRQNTRFGDLSLVGLHLAWLALLPLSHFHQRCLFRPHLYIHKF